jgi:hypothetical protein
LATAIGEAHRFTIARPQDPQQVMFILRRDFGAEKINRKKVSHARAQIGVHDLPAEHNMAMPIRRMPI